MKPFPLSRLVGLILLTGAVLGWALYSRRPPTPPPGAHTTPSSPIATPDSADRPIAQFSPSPAGSGEPPAIGATNPGANPPGPSDAELLAALPAPDPSATAVLSLLWSMAKGETPLEAARWRENLVWLARSGPGGLATVRAFLAQAEDLLLPDDLAAIAGQPTLRQALLALVGRRAGDGDPAARALLAEVLASAGDPREVTLAGRWLEKVAPGRYREPLLIAARESLALMLHPDSEPREVAPVLGILRELGDATLLPDLQQAARRWPDYGAWAVAGLPGGAGLPLLSEWVDRAAASAPALPAAALTQLAELSVHRQDAREALLAAAERGRIPEAAWSRLTLALLGERILPSDGLLLLEDPTAGDRQTGWVTEARAGQRLLTEGPAPSITASQWRQQQQLIDQLLNQTTDPEAREKLAWARSRLDARLQEAPGP